MKQRRSLQEILQSTSDVLFPAELGERVVTIDSCDVCGDTPLHVMVWRSDLYAVKWLLESGADVNAVGDMDETPLHVAIRKGSVDIIETLLSAGANTTIRSEFNQTSMEAAEAIGGEVYKLLKRHGR
ncbi:MAG: ankyrin repeat domain-containing protein [Steroidobacter sp.]